MHQSMQCTAHRPAAPALEPQLQPQARAEARTALPFAERELSFPGLNLASQARATAGWTLARLTAVVLP